MNYLFINKKWDNLGHYFKPGLFPANPGCRVTLHKLNLTNL